MYPKVSGHRIEGSSTLTPLKRIVRHNKETTKQPKKAEKQKQHDGSKSRRISDNMLLEYRVKERPFFSSSSSLQ